MTERFTGHGSEWRDANLSPGEAKIAPSWVELKVDKRSVIALTVPTWIPAFAVNQPADTAWRFSRENCDDAQEPAAQQTLKSLRTYACFKRTARPVYSVTFVPDPKPTNEAPAEGENTENEARQTSSHSDARTGGVRP